MKSEHAEGMGRRAFLQLGTLSAGALFWAGGARAVAERGPWIQETDKQLRVGIVGGRFGATFHWHEHPNCIVEAVSDLAPDRRQHLMQKYRCEKSYESLSALIEDPAVEAVAIFTPAPDHAKHTLQCLEKGKHVFCACPACLTIEEAEEIKAAVEATGLKYMNAETSYYRWETILARELITGGDLGALVYTEAEYYHPGIGASTHSLSLEDGERTWRYGYPPMLYPTHSTAFYIGVNRGRLRKVSCIGLRDDSDPAFPDNVYDNPFRNAMGMFVTQEDTPFRCNVGWHIHAYGERAQWFGEKGALYMPDCANRPLAVEVNDNRESVLPDYWERVPEDMRYDSGHGRSHPFLTHEFVMACVEDRAPAIDVYESLAYCVPGIVAHQSCFQDGAQLDIPSFDP